MPSHVETRSRATSSLSSTIVGATFLPEDDIGYGPYDKSIRYDIVCVTDSGSMINVEMQSASQKFYLHRALFYAARLVGRQGYKGTDSSGSM